MSKKFPFIALGPTEQLRPGLANGLYGLITYKDTRGPVGFLPRDVFPWVASTFEMKESEALQGSMSSDVGLIGEHELTKVFIGPMTPERRAELDKMLAEKDIELVPEKIAA